MKSDFAGFRPSVAAEVGVNAAVLYDNIAFWCERNRIAGRHVIDGKAWTYNSYATYAALYPWMSEKMVRAAINLLEERGFIISGYHSEDKRDRTKWYADARVGMETRPVSTRASAPEGNMYIEQLPTTATTPVPSVLQTDDRDPVIEFFEECLWKNYPNKASKKGALKAWKAAAKKDSWAMIHERLAARIEHWKKLGTEPRFIPHLATWLNQERWNDPLEDYAGLMTDAELFEEVERHLKEKYSNGFAEIESLKRLGT